MKVTKGETALNDNEVIAFYTGEELMFRDRYSNKNYTLSENSVYKGSIEFSEYLKKCKNKLGFIAFYKGDTISIQL